MQWYDIKRFAECIKYDPDFAGQFNQNGAAALAAYQIAGEPQTLARVLASHQDLSEPDATLFEKHPAFIEYGRFTARLREATEGSRHVTMLSGTTFGDWHARQKVRFSNQAPEGVANENSHIYFAVELSKGCSVGCPYCAGAARKLQGHYAFTESSCRLLLDTIMNIHRQAGGVSPRGCLYCYTEPFDNPDYERFLERYYETFNVIPQTTSAGWKNHVERTTTFLTWCLENGAGIQRLSINSLDDFRLCMRRFTPAVLQKVLLACRYPEADGVIYKTGRARRNEEAVDGTTCCLTGFQINMLDKSIELVTPCIEPERWPFGYRVIASGTFETGADVDAFLTWCCEHVFNQTLEGSTPLRLRRDLSINQEHNNVFLLSRYKKFTFKRSLEKKLIMLLDGRHTLDSLTQACGEEAGEVYTFLLLLWDQGLLAEAEGLIAKC